MASLRLGQTILDELRNARVMIEGSVERRTRPLRAALGGLSAGDSAYYPVTAPARRHDESPGRPDFVGIGAQRSGTSWWFELMTQHAKIHHGPFVRYPKERQFLSHFALESFDTNALRCYTEWFPRVSGTVTGEWTPDYFYYSWVPRLLRVAAPEARLLLLLRDPVERFVSGVKLSSTISRNAQPAPYIHQEAFGRGLYASQLRSWLAEFPQEQILILQFERCVHDPDAQLEKTFSFLGLEPMVTRNATRPVNRTIGRKAELSREVRQRLVDLYSDDVEELRTLFVDLDLAYWPNFSHLN